MYVGLVNQHCKYKHVKASRARSVIIAILSGSVPYIHKRIQAKEHYIFRKLHDQDK